MMTHVEAETSNHCKLLMVLLQDGLFNKHIEIYKDWNVRNTQCISFMWFLDVLY
jgi:hypothetical protein